MDEVSGRFGKASAHVRSFIVVDLAVVEIHHCVKVRWTDPNVNASALPNKERKRQGNVFQRGDG